MEILPFSNPSEHQKWQSKNCKKCQKHYNLTVEGYPTCEIEENISMASFGLYMSLEMFQRMGGTINDDGSKTINRCSEFEERKY